MRSAVVLVGAVGAMIFGSPVLHAQHLDIMLYREGSALRSGGFDFGALPSVLVGFNVFGESLIHIPQAAPGVAYAGAPGWNALSLPDELPPGGQTLPGGVPVWVSGPTLPTALSGRNLAYWSGTGVPSFGQVPSGEVLAHAVPDPFGGGRLTVYNGTADPAPALQIGSTGPTGGMHNHPSYALFGNALLNGQSADTPTNGIYLLSLQASIQGLTDAPPVYVLFSHGVPGSALSTARLFVRSSVDPSLRDGDADLDGNVDFTDLLTLAQHYGSSNADWARGDFDFDGVVGFEDLLALAQNYAAADSQSTGDLALDWSVARSVVPEPVMPATVAAVWSAFALRRIRSDS